MSKTNTRRALALIAAAFALLTLFILEARAQSALESQAKITTPLEPLRFGVSGGQLFEELTAHNDLSKSELRDYTALRTYRVVDLKDKVHAKESGRMESGAPEQKRFVGTSESGSGLIRKMALNPVISSEISAAAGKKHHDSANSPANHSLEMLGEQQVGLHHCFVTQAIPKRKDKYLFEGKLWIDADDCAVVRIEGHPAKKLLFRIQRANFVRQYQKVDGFWFPEREQTFVDADSTERKS